MILVFLMIQAREVLYAQDPVFSQFYSSPLTVNPALAGNGNANWRLIINNRNQWIGEGLDPLSTTSISLDGKLFKQELKESNYIGGGLMFLQDKGLGGAYKANSFHGIISSHVSLDEDDQHGLSVGLGGTYSNTLIDFSQLSFGQQLSFSGFNRALPTVEPNLSGVKPYFAMFAGITYSFNTEGTSFDVGVSGYRFLKTNRSALNDPTQLDPPRYNVHADYQTYLSDRLVLNMNGMYVFESGQNSYTAGLNFGHLLDNSDEPTVLNTGIWYRDKDAVIPYLGFSFKNFQAGVTYDVNINSGSATSNLKTFEFSLIIRSPNKSPNLIPCPWK
jgi:type IX secretion system PorP/SprF family membrane protein